MRYAAGRKFLSVSCLFFFRPLSQYVFAHPVISCHVHPSKVVFPYYSNCETDIESQL